ncbi:MAG TPA: FtsX-like permease family protein [Solirubrobacteraceae bacterium]|nr:FtsX-like permease family protein [Solirubrobacteraceae bacterium]
MRLGTIFYLYRVRLRARLVQELLAVAGIAVGVALLFASQVANTSLTGSVSQLTNGIVGEARLQIAARSASGFNEKLLAEVERVPGVLAAAPVLQRSASIAGPGGEASVDLIGLNPRFIRLNKQLLAHLNVAPISSQPGVALPAPLASSIGVGPLQTAYIRVGDRSVPTKVGVVLQRSDIGSLVDSQVVISPLVRAQQIAGMVGNVNRILVEPQPGRELEVSRRLRGLARQRLNVLPANFEAAIFRQAEEPTVQSTQIFSAISALVGFLFAFNALLLTVPQRRNLIADLRLDGYSPAEIVEVMLFDVFVLALVGVTVGLLVGDLLSHGLLRAEPGYLSLAFPVGSQHVIRWQSVAIAAFGGVAATALGVLAPLRHDITGTSSAGGRRRQSSTVTGATMLVVGMVCLALVVVLLVAGLGSVGATIVGFVSLTLALLLVMPTVFGALVAAIDRLQRPLLGVAPRIALIELTSSSTRPRSLAIAATGAIAVFGSVAIEGAQGNLRVGLSHAASELSRDADAWVSPSGTSTTLATTPFPNSYRQLLAGLPSVSKVNLFRGAFLDLGARRVLILAPAKSSSELLPDDQIVQGRSTLARTRMRTAGWVALSQDLAREWKLHVGDSFTLASPAPTRFRVAALITNLGWSPGAIMMNAGDFAAAWQSRQVSAYQLDFRPGGSLTGDMSEVRHALRNIAPGLVVQSTAQHEQNGFQAQHQGLARLTQIAVLVLIAAALAMAAAMAAMIWQRRARLAGMKVDGYSSSELWRALLWETALLLSVGGVIGAMFGLFGQLLLSRALVEVTGFPLVYSLALPVAVASLAVVSTIALIMVAIPGYLAAQVKPALQD